jgi:hypothetical protein
MDTTQQRQRRATAVITLRLSARDRALLQALLEREARAHGRHSEEASLSSVMRDLIRRAARARGVDVDVPPAPLARSRTPRVLKSSQDIVRSVLIKRLVSGPRGLAAAIARRLDVHPAQLSRFRYGRESFPARKAHALFELLHDIVQPRER